MRVEWRDGKKKAEKRGINQSPTDGRQSRRAAVREVRSIASVANRLHFVDVALVDALLDVGQTADVQRGVWQRRVHPRQPEDGEEGRQHRYHKQVPVVGRTFLQPLQKSRNNRHLNKARNHTDLAQGQWH